MSSSSALGLPQDEQSTPHPTAPRFYPFISSKHSVTKNRYITSSDPRGYIPVYEYPLNGHWLMIDSDNGYVLWTGIWKALGNSKTDIVKIVESQPELASQLRRVRGGYLKIQGTWMPYEIALGLARRVAWTIREDLIPLFGPTFPSTCLAPDQPGFGQLLGTSPITRRRTRRTMSHSESAVAIPFEPRDNNTSSERLSSFSGSGTTTTQRDHTKTEDLSIPSSTRGSSHLHLQSLSTVPQGGWQDSGPSSTTRAQVTIPLTPRYSPYPAGERSSSNFQQTAGSYYDNNNGNLIENAGGPNLRFPPPGSILLPPIPAAFHRGNNGAFNQQQQQQGDYALSSGRWTRNSGVLNDKRPIAAVVGTPPILPSYSLPPISALDAPGAGAEEGFNVLRRLRMDDNNNGLGRYSSNHDSSNFDDSFRRHRPRSPSPVNPSFQQPCDPARPRSASDNSDVHSTHLPYPHSYPYPSRSPPSAYHSSTPSR